MLLRVLVLERGGLDMSVVVGDGDCSVISSCLRSKQEVESCGCYYVVDGR